MVTSIVSVRMPSSLVQRLRELAKENHFLDTSEEVRSIIKSQLLKYKVIAGEIKLVEEESPAEKKTELKKSDFKTENLVKEELVRRLKKMIEEIQHE
jgi:Arc/MetJ-type ribon-helix-helix transcriptional regulator